MKILIVDDSTTMRRLVMRALRQTGYKDAEILQASDGAEGLEVLEGGSVDLILSDVNMPNMTGLEMLRRVRENDDTKGIPVVMITTESSSSMATELEEAGANACVGKPFTGESLEPVLKQVVKSS